MNQSFVHHIGDPVAVTQRLVAAFQATAVERDRAGGIPWKERQLIRESGLLRLMIPQEYGGLGASWQTMGQITRDIAQVDSSIAHVFSYHHLGVGIPEIFGTPEQAEYYYRQTVEQGWFWCNALNPLDRRAILSPNGHGDFVLQGHKSFCSGAGGSDILPLTAVDSETGYLQRLVIPTQRSGVIHLGDWDNMGQRQTDSGGIRLDHVWVARREVLRRPQQDPFGTIRACLTQWNLANIFVGIGLGALYTARDYTREQSQPWLNSGVDSPGEDPYILEHYGQLWVALQGAAALVDRATVVLQQAWDRKGSLTEQERGECAVAIATAKVAATQAGLDAANRIFQVMGARSTANRFGFDRFWRNLRTFTLHDPVEYKARLVGDWVLNGNLPQPNFYQ